MEHIMKNTILLTVLGFLFLLFSESVFSQSLKWSSPQRDGSYQRVGWLISKNNPKELRFWQFDLNTNIFVIMDGALSNTPYMDITLSSNESPAYSQVGQVDYEPNLDFNGDGYNDLVIFSGYTTPTFRYGLKIIDFQNGQTLFTLDDESYSYDLINSYDYDNDGKLEIAVDRRNINTNLSEVQVYSTNGNATSISENIKNIPGIYQLKQNYPNPFNPSTKIEYSISEPSIVSINIFNINGELIKELINEEKNNGNYSITWNGKDNKGTFVASGTYFYQIQVGDFVQAKKMILLR
jgi:hypothetical protein